MSKWISVNDELPREMVDIVLVGRKGQASSLPARYIDGKFIVIDGFHTIMDRIEYKDPTHWTHLIEPPN